MYIRHSSTNELPQSLSNKDHMFATTTIQSRGLARPGKVEDDPRPLLASRVPLALAKQEIGSHPRS